MKLPLTKEWQERLMREALDEAKTGVSEGEAPIGCVVALWKGGRAEIVARGHNRSNALGRKTAHAEIVAFENGGSVNGKPPSLPLDAKDIILVSNLEPCVMCLGAAMETGVKTVLYALKAPADNGTQRMKPPDSPDTTMPEIIGGILEAESRQLFVEWYEKHQGTEQAKYVGQLLALTE